MQAQLFILESYYHPDGSCNICGVFDSIFLAQAYAQELIMHPESIYARSNLVPKVWKWHNCDPNDNLTLHIGETDFEILPVTHNPIVEEERKKALAIRPEKDQVH